MYRNPLAEKSTMGTESQRIQKGQKAGVDNNFPISEVSVLWSRGGQGVFLADVSDKIQYFSTAVNI